MLSKPLALQLVRMRRPSFWQCERAGLKSYCLCTVTKKTLCICWCRQIKWLWFRFFQRSGTFPLSSTHSLCEAQSLHWVLLATDIGLSWEAVIIILTVPEHTGATVDTKYWAAPGVWAKLRKTHERKNTRICQYIHNIRTGAFYHSHSTRFYRFFKVKSDEINPQEQRSFNWISIRSLLSFKVYVHEKRKVL